MSQPRLLLNDNRTWNVPSGMAVKGKTRQIEEKRKITVRNSYDNSHLGKKFLRVNQTSRCFRSTNTTVSRSIWVVNGKACVFQYVWHIWATPARNRLGQVEADERSPPFPRIALDWKRLDLAGVVVYQARAHTNTHECSLGLPVWLQRDCELGVPERRLPLGLKNARQQPTRPMAFSALSHAVQFTVGDQYWSRAAAAAGAHSRIACSEKKRE